LKQFLVFSTTELARAAQLSYDFAIRNTKLIALSCNSTESHLLWLKDIVEYGNKYYGQIRQKSSEHKSILDGMIFILIKIKLKHWE
jgi:alkyl hydroperoxide reductase subunit AhpC